MKERFEELLKALISERDFELNAYKSLVSDRPMRDRVAEGVTLYPIEFTEERFNSFNDLILEFNLNPEQSGKLFGANGKCQLFSSTQPETLDGIIVRKTDSNLSLQLLSDESPDWIRDGKLGLNAVCDTRTYDVQIKALEELKESKRGIAYQFYHQTFKLWPVSDFNEDAELNPSQNLAVKNSLADTAFHAVHGPPGTGKTHTITHAISRLVKDDKRILVAAPTNAAADHITEQILKTGIDVLRYGNSFKIADRVESQTLPFKIQKHADMQVIQRLTKDADSLRKKAFRFIRNFDAEAQAERKQLRQELRDIQKEIRSLERNIRGWHLEKSPVIVGTLIGLQQAEIIEQKFDVLFVDEAGQALEPAIWSLARHSDKIILAGDPYQLPPVLFSPQAEKSPLAVSLIEMALRYNHPTTLLDTQYRMNDLIMQFSNQKFYGGKLKSGAHNAAQSLVGENWLPLEFIDTAGCGYQEETDESGGIGNVEEANILIKRLAEFGATDKSIGIISPYRKQILILQDKTETSSCYVQTVDSFQGQERDIILISLVRSNDEGEIGFLKDYRRMNVAMTRARYKLVIIGDSATIANDPFYADLLDFVQENGSYRTAWEYFEQ